MEEWYAKIWFYWSIHCLSARAKDIGKHTNQLAWNTFFSKPLCVIGRSPTTGCLRFFWLAQGYVTIELYQEIKYSNFPCNCWISSVIFRNKAFHFPPLFSSFFRSTPRCAENLSNHNITLTAFGLRWHAAVLFRVFLSFSNRNIILRKPDLLATRLPWGGIGGRNPYARKHKVHPCIQENQFSFFFPDV